MKVAGAPSLSRDHAPSSARLGGLLLILAVLVVYLPLGWGDYLNFDDPIFIEMNRRLDGGFTWQNLRWAFFANLTFFSPSLEYWSPMTALSRLADVEIWRKEPGGSHLTSVVLHGLSAALLYGALRRLTGRAGVAWWVAVVFALHPLAVEPVSWLSARKDVVYGLFWNLTLLVYAVYAQAPSRKRYLLFLAAFLLAAMSKPMVLTLPCVLLLLDIWPLGRVRPPWPLDAAFWRSLRGPLVEKLPLFGCSLLLAWLAMYSQKNWGAVASNLPLSFRLQNVVLGYWEYLRLVFWPLGLCPIHPLRPEAPPWLVLLAGGGLALITGFALWQIRRAPWLAVGWLWFCGVIFPVSGIVQIGTARMAERYTYVALPGLALALGWAALNLWERLPAERVKRLRGPAIALGALLILGMAGVSACRAWIWQDPVRVWQASLRTYPDSPIFLRQLAVAQWSQGLDAESAQSYLRSMKLDPQNSSALYGLSRIALDRGDFERADAALTKARQMDGKYYGIPLLHAEVLYRQGRYAESLQMLSPIMTDQMLFPEVWLMQARLQYAQGDREGALKSMERCWLMLRLATRDSS